MSPGLQRTDSNEGLVLTNSSHLTPLPCPTIFPKLLSPNPHLENCDGSRTQAQEETVKVMSQVAMWVSMLRSCLPPLEQFGAPLVDAQHPMAGFRRAPHLCRLDVPGTLGTQLLSSNWFWISRPRDSSVVANLH